ncbi:hypothetical protein T10_9423, partial [Trichinella papuae]
MVNNYLSIKKQLIIIFVVTLLCDTVKLMKQRKVKARMTRSKSRTAHRRTRDAKRCKEWSKEKLKTRMTRNKSQTAHRKTRDEKRCLIISKGALVRLTYVASGSVAKCSL